MTQEEKQSNPTKKPKTKYEEMAPVIIVCAVILSIGVVFGAPFIVNHFKAAQLQSSMQKADQFYNAGKDHWKKAQPLYLKALQYAKNNADEKQIAKISYKIGRIYLYEGQFVKARLYFNDAIELYDNEDKAYRNTYIDSCLGLAQSYSRDNKFSQAEEYLDLARDQAIEWELSPTVIGNVYFESAENAALNPSTHKQALEFYDKAIKEYSKPENQNQEKIAQAWLKSAELCTKNGWRGEGLTRSVQALNTSMKLAASKAKTEIERKSKEAKAANEKTPGKTSDALILKGEAEIAKFKLEQIERAQALNKRIKQHTERSFAEITDKLQRPYKGSNKYSSLSRELGVNREMDRQVNTTGGIIIGR